MANNIVSKLLLDDKDYNAKLDKAKKSTSAYQKDIESLGKSVGGSVVKAFGAATAAIGLTGGAVVTFNKFINSTNESTDKWEASVRAAKTSVDTFFASLRSGDFTPFSLGLDDIIAKARETAGALDQLSDTQISYNFFSSKNQANFAEAITNIKDTELSTDMRKKAKQNAEIILKDQKEITASLRRDMETAVQSLATENNLLDPSKVNFTDLENIIRTNVSYGRDAIKAALSSEYENYLSEIGRVRPVSATVVGSTSQSGMYISSRIEDPADRKRYDNEVTAISSKYKNAVLYDTMLRKNSEEWLDNMTAIVASSDLANKLYFQMEATLNKASKSLNKMKQDTTFMADEMSRIPDITFNPGSMAGFDTAKNVVAKGNKAPTFIETPEVIKQSGESFQVITDNAGQASEAVGGLASIMGSLGSVVDDNGDSWLNWLSNVLQSVATALPAIMSLTAAEKLKANASAQAAVAGGASSVAATPFVGPILAVAAVASILAALASVPKFATGGVVPGASFLGDNIIARVNSGEVVLNKEQQNILSDRLDGGLSGQVEFKIKDSQLVGILNSYYSRNSRKI